MKNNFDLLRLAFALLVVLSHTISISNILILEELKNYLLPASTAVEGFFVISGYLILMSYKKSSSISSYFLKRIRRIYPAYIFVIFSSAFFLYFVSENSFNNYFFTPEWTRYLFSNLFFTNFIQPSLPGVFNNGPINGSLWTIKIEVMFYFTIPLIAWLISKSNKHLIFVVIYVFSIAYALTFQWLLNETQQHIYYSLYSQLPTQLAYFISGGYLYLMQTNFKTYKNKYLFFAMLGLLLSYSFNIYFLYPVSYSILVVYFAIHFKYLGNFGKYGDLSYGMYIYHFPLAQLFLYLNIFTKYGLLGYLFLIVLVFFLSYLSWHFLEKPFLRKKSHYRLEEE